MSGGTVTTLVKFLQYDAVRMTKDSFAEGYEIGKELVWWTRYNKRKIVSVASTSRYLGARKDRPAYQVGIVVGYLEEAHRLQRLSKSEELTLDDIALLGLRPEGQEQRKSKKK